MEASLACNFTVEKLSVSAFFKLKHVRNVLNKKKSENDMIIIPYIQVPLCAQHCHINYNDNNNKTNNNSNENHPVRFSEIISVRESVYL